MSSKIIQRNSRIHGQGVFATADIAAGEEVVEYQGKLRTHAEVDEEYGGQDTGHTFLFILNDTYVIDANTGGNVARWINHGCAPNCKAFVIEDGGGDPRKDKVVIEALHDIHAGQELTYDYDIRLEGPITPEERELWACKCGAPNCSGSMLKAPKARKRPAVPA
jgi:SET domain-containing protein